MRSRWLACTDICSQGRLFTTTEERHTPPGAHATYCASIAVKLSMGRTGVCWDNAAAESFFTTLQNEMCHRQRFATKAQARFTVTEYIEVFYNRTRMQPTLGYRTPTQAPSDYRNAATAA